MTTWDELMSYQPQPVQSLWWATCRRTSSTRRSVRFAYQRVVRGWDDTALWSLDDHVSKTLGAQLLAMAQAAMSYPGDEVYPSFEQWQTDLRKHGEALLTYQAKHYEVYGADWDAIYVPAQEALHWVAEHFAALWD